MSLGTASAFRGYRDVTSPLHCPWGLCQRQGLGALTAPCKHAVGSDHGTGLRSVRSLCVCDCSVGNTTLWKRSEKRVILCLGFPLCSIRQGIAVGAGVCVPVRAAGPWGKCELEVRMEMLLCYRPCVGSKQGWLRSGVQRLPLRLWLVGACREDVGGQGWKAVRCQLGNITFQLLLQQSLLGLLPLV